MILNLNEQEKLLGSLKEEISNIEHGRVYCTLVIADQRLMYVDFKREKNHRVYIHCKPVNQVGEKV